MPAFAILLAAAVTATPFPYKAVGTEPFWSVTIERGRMTFQPAEGRQVRVATPRPTAIRNGRRYRTAAFSVDITRRPCSDGMSDRRFPDTVQVRLGRRVLSGCGGAPAEAGGLEGGSWRIALVNGRAPRLDQPATLTFANASLGGRVCNSLRGSYTLARGTLTAGPVAATRMMCAPAVMEAERAVIAALGQKLYVHQGSGGLVLSNGSTSLTLRR